MESHPFHWPVKCRYQIPGPYSVNRIPNQNFGMKRLMEYISSSETPAFPVLHTFFNIILILTHPSKFWRMSQKFWRKFTDLQFFFSKQILINSRMIPLVLDLSTRFPTHQSFQTRKLTTLVILILMDGQNFDPSVKNFDRPSKSILTDLQTINRFW